MSRYKKIELTPRKIDEIAKEASAKAMILFAAYLMDDEDFNAERICEVWDGVTRYADAVDKKLISLDKVCGIINNYTGLKIRW